MKVNGKMIKHMAMENIYIWMGQLTKDFGRMINNTVTELKHGLTGQYLRESTKMVKSMVKASSNGEINPPIRGTS